MEDEVIAEVRASPARRWIAIGMLFVIGGLVIYVAMATSPEFIWRVFLIAVGLSALWVAERLRRATDYVIELTEAELRDSGGERIALVEDIVSLDRGFLAFKPSNGFLIKTRRPGARVWRPGLWWRLGRRVGVGGVTPGSQTRVMSDILAAMLAARDQVSDHTT